MLGLAQCYVTKRKVHGAPLKVERDNTRQVRRMRCKPPPHACRSLDALIPRSWKMSARWHSAIGGLLRGTRYRTIYYFARDKSAWGAWFTILLDFDTFHVYQDQDFVVLSTTGHGARPEALLQQNRQLSANSEAIHFSALLPDLLWRPRVRVRRSRKRPLPPEKS